MSDTLAELRADFETLRADWKDGAPWLQARVANAYQRWFRQSVAEGRPPDALRKHSPVESERFFARVIPGPDGHSYWNGDRFRCNDGSERMPRRWWWEHVHGPITDRGVPKPVCDEPHCITVQHLRLVSWGDMRRMFTDEQCVGALQVAAMRLGYTPTRDQYNAMHIRPSGTLIEQRYSSWRRAVRAAGLPEPPSFDRPKLWSAADCVQALRDFVAEHGFVPTGAHWARLHLSPSEKTILRRLGGWRRALRAAGLDK